MEVWAYPTSTSGYQRFIDLGTAGVTTNGIMFGRYNSNSNFVDTFNGTSGIDVQSNSNSPINTWQHIVATVSNAGAVKFYLNAAPNGTGTTRVVTAVTRTSNNIGKSNLTGDAYYGGKLSVVRIYNRVLTDQEVKQNCNAQQGRFGITSCATP
jgi:hypothetical protein